jgi:hypothetical protein
MPATTNEWIGLALATGLLLLLAAGLAVLGWRGLRALMRVVREQRFDNADEAWKAVSTGSALTSDVDSTSGHGYRALPRVARIIAYVVMAPVALTIRALKNSEGRNPVTESEASDLGEWNAAPTADQLTARYADSWRGDD